ncbi:GIY-YIG nuclease family protein, partial [Acinetobacter baumannii]
IGMTRRLEPMDRVNELGDASVPFYFDVHAMIYSDNAPAMENALHRVFAERRLNLVNLRKEFFHVTLDEIQKEVHKISSDAEFTITAEA